MASRVYLNEKGEDLSHTGKPLEFGLLSTTQLATNVASEKPTQLTKALRKGIEKSDLARLRVHTKRTHAGADTYMHSHTPPHFHARARAHARAAHSLTRQRARTHVHTRARTRTAVSRPLLRLHLRRRRRPPSFGRARVGRLIALCTFVVFLRLRPRPMRTQRCGAGPQQERDGGRVASHEGAAEGDQLPPHQRDL
jgi:hypothetical protein